MAQEVVLGTGVKLIGTGKVDINVYNGVAGEGWKGKCVLIYLVKDNNLDVIITWM